MPCHKSYRTLLIRSGYTPEQLNVIDAHLDATYYAVSRDGGEMFEFADNLRIARVDNQKEIEEYEKQRNSGCCGFYDKEIEHPDGNILIGFNFGH